MGFLIVLVLLILVLSAVFTFMLAGKTDEGYHESARRNTVNLTLIYAIVIVLALGALVAYVRWFV